MRGSEGRARVAALRNVTKRYGPVTAVDRLDLAVVTGEILAVLGPNGAGKTTSINLLLGLLAPDEGSVELFGGKPTLRAARQRVGVMLQVGHVPETMTVREHLELFASYYPAPMPPDRAIAVAGLTGLEHRMYGKLSGGQKQRVLFGLAICGNPDLVFLDEPTVGMDVESRRAFWNVIREIAGSGRTIVLTTHYLEEADALADRIVVIDHGCVVAEGTPSEIKARSAGRRIRCVTRLTVADVSALPGVTTVRASGAITEILASDAEPVVVELLRRDPGLTGLEVSGAGLEEAFLSLTEKNGKKEAA
jgi:ABC-2 type transport system ATP-binding protein